MTTAQMFTIENWLDAARVLMLLGIVCGVVGGIYSFLRQQVASMHGIYLNRQPSDLSGLHAYTKSLLNGSSPELRRLQALAGSADPLDREHRRVLISGICNTLELRETHPIRASLIREFQARL